MKHWNFLYPLNLCFDRRPSEPGLTLVRKFQNTPFSYKFGRLMRIEEFQNCQNSKSGYHRNILQSCFIIIGQIMTTLNLISNYEALLRLNKTSIISYYKTFLFKYFYLFAFFPSGCSEAMGS